MPVLNVSGASRNVPEPQAVNVDPARANAVYIPNAMPTVAVLAVPNVAIMIRQTSHGQLSSVRARPLYPLSLEPPRPCPVCQVAMQTTETAHQYARCGVVITVGKPAKTVRMT